MLVRLQWMLVWLANGLSDYFLMHWPWQIVLVEQLFLLPFFLCSPNQPVIKTLRAKSTRSAQRSEYVRVPPRVDPPVGYLGPFWNKPSATYLSTTPRSFSPGQESVVYLVLIAVFAALILLLLHY